MVANGTNEIGIVGARFKGIMRSSSDSYVVNKHEHFSSSVMLKEYNCHCHHILSSWTTLGYSLEKDIHHSLIIIC